MSCLSYDYFSHTILHVLSWSYCAILVVVCTGIGLLPTIRPVINKLKLKLKKKSNRLGW